MPDGSFARSRGELTEYREMGVEQASTHLSYISVINQGFPFGVCLSSLCLEGWSLLFVY